MMAPQAPAIAPTTVIVSSLLQESLQTSLQPMVCVNAALQRTKVRLLSVQGGVPPSACVLLVLMVN